MRSKIEVLTFAHQKRVTFVLVVHTYVLTGVLMGLCWETWRVKMAWLRDDWAFMLVLPTVLDRAPCFRHNKVWGDGIQITGQ